ncbi:transposase [Azospirillum canadense]|uniref:transposase n=1 Tax=Azospirillum canadense TaxID=403962 RepID=UPI00222687D5|nr:transposase [Azospirillum canadense]
MATTLRSFSACRRPQRPRATTKLGNIVRWRAERTFAWLGRHRRLSKDYERLPESEEAFIYMAMSHILVKRLARPPLHLR